MLSPYGQPTENRNVDGDGREVAFNMCFPGQYHDRETGLYYNRNRTYDPATGRYLQSDPIGLGGGANAYHYANANPVNLADPNGTIACGGLCVGAAVLGAADMALSVYDAYQTYNTLSDECASAGDKSMAVAALGAGLVLPGSYGWVDDAAEGVVRGAGRSGKQARLRELANDDKLGAADRGWIKQEMNSIGRGQRKNIRNPPGKDLAHERGREAAKGYGYKHSNLQDRDLHRSQHKYDNFGKKKRERPPQ